MPTIFKLRRGTQSENRSFIGDVGELTFDTQNNTVIVHDGATAGGRRLQQALTGAIAFFAKTSAPEGWLKANGAEVSRSTYSELFNQIGTLFGDGNGSTTFNLPDARAEFIRGWDDGRGVDISRSFGSFQSDQIKEHRHDAFTKDSGAVDDFLGGSGNNFGIQRGAGDFPTLDFGGDETRPRNIALLACIKY